MRFETVTTPEQLWWTAYWHSIPSQWIYFISIGWIITSCTLMVWICWRAQGPVVTRVRQTPPELFYKQVQRNQAKKTK